MGAPAQFRFPDVEDAALFRAVREKWHPHLDGYYIALVFRDKPRVLGGRKCAATARCVPEIPRVRDLPMWVPCKLPDACVRIEEPAALAEKRMAARRSFGAGD